MRRMCASLMVAAALALTTQAAFAAEGEKYEDAVGDAVGDAPDIVAVTVDEPDGTPVLSVGVEFADERPFGADGETWTDALFVTMATDPTITLPADAEYTLGTHGVTLPGELDTGSFLVTQDELYWAVVDLARDGSTITFTVDRKLLGDPSELYLRVLVGVDRDDATEEEGDSFPDEGESPVRYTLRKPIDRPT